MMHNLFDTLREFDPGNGKKAKFYSLLELEKAGIAKISRLPVSIRVVLESVLRNCDGRKITEEHIIQLAKWGPTAHRTEEIPFVVARILLQDFTGVPLLCDLAAMRGVAAKMGKDPGVIEPLVPVDLVVDHSVQIDTYGSTDALKKNLEMEFKRNRERYEFLKWGMHTFRTFKVLPPGIGIVHQVNLEHLARGVHEKNGLYYPDTLVGTDSHTTMINGIGVVSWGVGGIEAEAGMLGQPLYFLTPDVVGVNLTGKLREGVNATDLVLTITQRLRKEKVVGAFVEFFGSGTESLSVPDRATLANMAPEYGATMGFFPVDDITRDYFQGSGRTVDEITAFGTYFKAQGMYGIPKPGDIDYTRTLEVDLSTIKPCVAGPKRPQDLLDLPALKNTMAQLFVKSVAENGFAKMSGDLARRFTGKNGIDIGSGDVVIAAITSCTNTSNPSVLLAAGLLAKKAVEKGLRVNKKVKTSLAPGSRVVTEYLKNAGLLSSLEQLGFYVSAYGCTTCIGNSGPLDEAIEEAIIQNDLVCAAVLSGNRNFEARIHPNIRANFLMSPPLVVAFALAGTVLWNPDTDPVGVRQDGSTVFLKDIWPSSSELASVMLFAAEPALFQRLYSTPAKDHALWNSISAVKDEVYLWPKSTYIAEPPFFKDFALESRAVGNILGARTLAIFGDSLTTDHISPAGPIKEASPAGQSLIENGVAKKDFQSYGTRRGNHEVMIRGTFASVRIKNLMVPPKKNGTRVEGGVTLFQPTGELVSIYEAAMKYMSRSIPTVVFGGEEYGTGSSRDWAAKGPALLGVRAVIAKSFERIHRSNLVDMGVLPLQFRSGESVQSLNIKGDEDMDILGLDKLKPKQNITLVIKRRDGSRRDVTLLSRIDTPIEVDYFVHGGILPYLLRELLSEHNH